MHGNDNFDVIPESFILPEMLIEFREVFNNYQQHQTVSNPNIWIVKPSA